MTLSIRASTLIDAGLWPEYCALTGTNLDAIECRDILPSDKVELDDEEADYLGITFEEEEEE